MYQSRPELEADVQALAERLRRLSLGEIVTYAELDQVLGRPVRPNHRYLLVRAKTLVEREDGSIFASVYRIGMRRLPVEAYASVGQYARRLIRRRARSASTRMGNALAKTNDVSPDVERAVWREQANLGLIAYVAREATMRKMMPDDKMLVAPPPLAQVGRDLLAALTGDK